MNRILHFVVFAVGLAVVCWIGAGYVTSNPLALLVTTLIGAVYLVGATELYRYQQATSSLAGSLAQLSAPPSGLGAWLEQLHPSLRNAVRMRVEGERVGLPGPALTPYLVGLLVLLGMLGTFLGMVATLRGTGLAMESSTDLEAIRASLAAPVKGLAFAFGTSVAGVATSAMLGLLSALCRRERIAAAQALDASIASTLRVFSLTHQREEGFKLMQRQAEVMPVVVDRLQAMMTAIEQQNKTLNERLLANQDIFHDKAEATYTGLASSVGQTLRESVVDGVRAASAAIQPAVEATMAGLVRETAALHDTVTQAVQQQLDGLSTRFESTTTTVADIWKEALARQQLANESLTKDLHVSLTGFADTFEQRSTTLLDGVSTRMEGVSGNMSAAWDEAMSRHERSSEKLAGDNQLALTAAAASMAQHSAALVQKVGQAHEELRATVATQDEQRLAAWTSSLEAMAASLREQWQRVGTDAASRQQEMCDALALTARDISAETRTHSSSTLAEIDRLVQVAAEAPQAALALQSELAAQDQQRLAAWTASLASMAAALREEWQQAGAHATSRQREMCDALAQTAREISSETRTHASSTLAEIDRLVQVAAEAPNAALALQTELASQDQQRLEAWTASLASMATALREEWQQAGAHATSRQQDMCDALAQTAREISSETRTHASTTLAEIDKLVQVAAHAPNAAAALQVELVAQDQQRLSAWTASLASMAAALREEWQQAGAHATSRQQVMCDALAQTAREISSETRTHASSTLAEIDRLVQAAAQAPNAAAALQMELVEQDKQRLSAWTASLGTMASALREEWQQAGAHATSRQQEMCDALAQTARDISSDTRTHATTTLAEIDRLVQAAAEAPKAAVALQTELASQDQQRLSAWTASLASIASTLREEWQQAGAHTASRQQEICEALAQTARDISYETQAHASSTIAEIARLVQAASEAPKVAADVITEVRQKLSDSMARDNAMLEERGRMLETLATLLDAVNHASTEQRAAVDALLETSADVLNRVTTQFTDTVEAETGKLTTVAAQVTGSAVEVASLGEAFGAAVQVFGQSNELLVGHLQRIEAALDKTTTRSDEQLAYYVAQAREVIDLSMMAQKQIVEDLQQLAGQRASDGAQAT